ncbi:hypothetical protein D3C73_1474040 [compost metagenome]
MGQAGELARVFHQVAQGLWCRGYLRVQPREPRASAFLQSDFILRQPHQQRVRVMDLPLLADESGLLCRQRQ